MEERFSSIFQKEKYNNSTIDYFVAILLAMAPILQHYKGLYENAGATVLIISFPYFLMKLLSKRYIDKTKFLLVLPLIFFDLYKAFDHGMTFGSIAHAILVIVIFVGIANGCFNFYYFFKACFFVSEIACLLIIIQYFCYYILGFHLQLVSINMLLPECEQWFAGIKTGLVSITGSSNGFYRPAAFFLEPSHFMLYVLPMFVLTLLSSDMNRWKIRKSILFSIGLTFTTSGMAVAFMVATWALYLLFRSKYYDGLALKRFLPVKNIIIAILGLLLLIIAYLKVPFVNSTVNRIIIGDQFGNTAISGRMRQANILLARISGKNLIFGVTKNISDITFNLSGYAATMYKYGIIGTILSYLVYVRSIIQLKQRYRVMSIIIFVLSFFTAHTHGTYHMIYFVIIILKGFYEQYYVKYEKCDKHNG